MGVRGWQDWVAGGHVNFRVLAAGFILVSLRSTIAERHDSIQIKMAEKCHKKKTPRPCVHSVFQELAKYEVSKNEHEQTFLSIWKDTFHNLPGYAQNRQLDIKLAGLFDFFHDTPTMFRGCNPSTPKTAMLWMQRCINLTRHFLRHFFLLASFFRQQTTEF